MCISNKFVTKNRRETEKKNRISHTNSKYESQFNVIAKADAWSVHRNIYSETRMRIRKQKKEID